MMSKIKTPKGVATGSRTQVIGTTTRCTNRCTIATPLRVYYILSNTYYKL